MPRFATLIPIRFIPLVAASLLALILGRGETSAFQVFDVDRLDDVAEATACTDAPNDCSLRGAIIASNAASGFDLVQLHTGKYEMAIPGVDEEAALTGDLDITGPLRIVGEGSFHSIVDANELDRVFDVRSGAQQVSIEGVQVEFGRGGGSGIYVSGTNLGLVDVSFIGGVATGSGGGGLYVIGATVSIVRGSFSKNGADSGGAIFVDTQSNVRITDSVIAGNSAGFDGGGIYAYQTSVDLTVSNSTISGNSAPNFAGGFYNAIGENGTATFENVTWSANSVTAFGGSGNAIFNDSAAPTNFRFNTFANNTGPAGSAMIMNEGGTPGFFANVFAGNTPEICGGTDAIGSLGYNVADDSNCGFSSLGDMNATNPDLASLAQNGGSTATHLLNEGSPAIDTVPPNMCTGFDQRGRTRPVDGGCDSGATEVGNPPTTNRIWGDNRCDGTVGVEDVAPVLALAGGVDALNEPLGSACPALRTGVFVDPGFVVTPWGDVDCDGDVDEADALFLLLFIAEEPLTPLLPCPVIGTEYPVG